LYQYIRGRKMIMISAGVLEMLVKERQAEVQRRSRTR
jgi:hypothetical protein